MNKIIVALVVFALSSFAFEIKAQGQKMDIASLTQRIDSLEHEVEFLKVDKQLRSLYTSIYMLNIDAYIMSISIQLDLNNSFDYELCESYKCTYQSFQRKKDTLSNCVDIEKTYLDLMCLKAQFNEIELEELMIEMDSIYQAKGLLENSMERLKVVIDAYENLR